MLEINENEKLLDKLYDTRNIELWRLTEKEKNENKEIIANNEINNKDLQTALNSLPDCFREVSNNIKKCVNKKIEGERELTGCYTKKYYQAGFSDAIKLILKEAMEDNKENHNGNLIK